MGFQGEGQVFHGWFCENNDKNGIQELTACSGTWKSACHIPCQGYLERAMKLNMVAGFPITGSNPKPQGCFPALLSLLEAPR